MVNPYEPTRVTNDEGDGASTPRPIELTRQPRFLGGLRTVLLIGAVSGAAMFGWGVAAGTLFNDPVLPMLGWAVLFFAMNFALMSFLRGLELASSTKFGCAALLTPVSMILFVPVCFGAVISMESVRSVAPRSMRFSDGFDAISLLVVTVFGFIVIVGIVSLAVRRWATSRLSRQPNTEFQSSAETESSL